MTTAAAGTTPCNEFKLYLQISQLFSTPIDLKICSRLTCTDSGSLVIIPCY